MATSAVEAMDRASSAVVLRRGLLALAAAGTVGVGLELLLLRHWTEPRQLFAWVAVVALALAVTLAVRASSRRTILVAHALAIATLVISLVGVVIHVWANYEAAPLDARYTASWPTTAEPVRWLLAATDTVGPSPSLAPLALAFVSLVLLLALVRHPALTGSMPEV